MAPLLGATPVPVPPKVDKVPCTVETPKPAKDPEKTIKDRPKAPPFELKDQFKKPRSITFPRDRVTVLMFADRRSARQAEKWVGALYDRYENRILYEGVGVGKSVPRWERPVICFILRRVTPEPIMLDWNSAIATTYDFQRRRLNLFVVDPAGGIVLKTFGPKTEEAAKHVFDAIDALLDAQKAQTE